MGAEQVWAEVPFGEIAGVRSGYAFKSSEWRDSGVPVVKIGNVKSGRLDMGGCSYVEPDTARASGFMLNSGDVLVGLTGYVGDTAVIGNEGPLVLNQRVGKVTARKGVYWRFVYYVLSAPDFRAAIERASHGSAQANVSPSAIEAIPVVVPPLPEQRAIAHILGALDDKIELNRRMNETLESMARALFKSWFVDFDPVRAKSEGRPPTGMDTETAQLFPTDFVDSQLGRIPKGWSSRPVLELADLVSGGTPKTSSPEFWDGEIKWASAKDISQCGSFFLTSTERTITEAGLAGSSSKIIPADAVAVVARGATCGRYTVFAEPIAMNQTCYALVAKFPSARWYLRFVAEDLFVKLVAQSHGSVFDTITTATFRTALAIDPGNELLCRFQTAVSPLIERVRALHYEAQTLAYLRDELLPRLLSGELSVASAERAAGTTT